MIIGCSKRHNISNEIGRMSVIVNLTVLSYGLRTILAYAHIVRSYNWLYMSVGIACMVYNNALRLDAYIDF